LRCGRRELQQRERSQDGHPRDLAGEARLPRVSDQRDVIDGRGPFRAGLLDERFDGAGGGGAGTCQDLGGGAGAVRCSCEIGPG